jgi:antitoxin CptB
MAMDEKESLENRRKKLIFRSWHRGTREMDLLLGSFAERHVPGFSEENLEYYAQILEISDPDLYNWISGVEKLPANMENPVLETLRAHVYAA